MCFIYKSNEQAKIEQPMPIDIICHYINDADQKNSPKIGKLDRLIKNKGKIKGLIQVKRELSM